jgi:hypoxanthine-DNA glycosylase
MIEYHPFPPFIPTGCRRIIIGSFPGKENTCYPTDESWSYGAKRNQFWPIMEAVFETKLSTKKGKQDLLASHKIGLADIIQSCERSKNSNLDSTLKNKTYNPKLEQIIIDNSIRQLLFTGKGVMKEFIKHFQFPENIELVVLPSPSPAFMRMTFEEKIQVYKKILD